MNDDLCPRDAEVLRASESDSWTAELRAHVDACATCREVEAVTRALLLAVEAEASEPPHAAEDIWWRAQWQVTQDAKARAMRPLEAIERAEPLVALVAVATLIVMRGDVIASRLLAWLSADGTAHAIQALLPPALMPILIVGAGLGGLVLLVGLGAVLAND